MRQHHGEARTRVHGMQGGFPLKGITRWRPYKKSPYAWPSSTFSKKPFSASDTLPYARFLSNRRICWLTFAAERIRNFSANHSCDTTVRRLHPSRFQSEEVVGVAHQHPGLDAPTGAFAGLAEGVQEEATVVVIMEDGLPAVAARHDMAVGSRGLDANAACQAQGITDPFSFSFLCFLIGALLSVMWLREACSIPRPPRPRASGAGSADLPCHCHPVFIAARRRSKSALHGGGERHCCSVLHHRNEGGLRPVRLLGRGEG